MTDTGSPAMFRPTCLVEGIYGNARWSLSLALATIALGVPASAAGLAGAPANDNRADAASVTPLPQDVGGTTVGATTELNEPASGCTATAGSVWYMLSVGSTPPGRIGIKLAASGDLDAAVDVYQRQRSQILSVGCRTTDRNGRTALAFTPGPGTTYLIRVAQLADSDAGTFSLNVFALPAPPSPPGVRLNARGASGALDGTLDTAAAYSMRLSAGTIYKINLIKPSQGCMRLSIFAPGTPSFGATPLAGLSCAGYRLFTPRVSGVWSFLISADPGNPGTQPYALHVRPASEDETAPGIFLPNFAHITDFLRGNVIDDVRLFRFDVTERSDLELFLQAASTAPFDLKLLDDRGHYIQCNCGSTGEETIRRQVPPGRYFAVVQAESFGWGPFTLYRQSRLITHVTVAIDGTHYEQVQPDTSIQITANVTPAVDGPVTIEVDSFDPVEGWQFYRYYDVVAVGGEARMPFVAPHTGRWRATASFDGTRTASPATTGFSQALVAGPLQQ
jgi:hypothetical protein